MTENVLNLTRNDGHGFRPPCYAELNAYTGNTFHEDFDLPHPIAIFNHSWGAVCQRVIAIIRVLDKIQESEGAMPDAADSTALLDSYEGLLHASDEFIENIEQNISKALGGKNGRVHISGSSSMRKIASIPCNKLKHNHNRLAYYEVRCPPLRISGFAMCHIHKGILRPNPEFHNKGLGCSFNAQIRKVVVALYLYAQEVGQKIKSIYPSPSILPSEADSSTISMLERISKLPVFIMPHETEKDMPKIDFNGVRLQISQRGGLTLPVKSGVATTMFSGDGHTRSFSVP